MLRLSKRADYALMAMKHLAQEGDCAMSAREIGERYDIPLELMAKVLQRLARNGLLASHKGTHGGYQLTLDPAAISVGDVVQAIEGPLSVTACSPDEVGEEQCDQYEKCNVRDPLWRIKERILAALHTVSVAELARDEAADAVVPATLHAPVTVAMSHRAD